MFKNTRMLAEAGIMVGLALALWYFNVGQLPQGGSISLQMLPLLVFALRWGAGPGIVVGMAYGFLHSLQDMFVLHPLQYLLDYPIAFGLIGLAGLVKNLRVNRVVSILLAIAILVSGVIIFHYTMVSTAEVKTQIAQLEQLLLVASPDEKPQLEEELSAMARPMAAVPAVPFRSGVTTFPRGAPPSRRARSAAPPPLLPGAAA